MPTQRADRSGSLRDPVLWGCLGLAFVLRLAALLRYPRNVALGDETIHYVMSVLASRLGSDVFGQWAPAYDALLAAVFRAAGPDPVAAKLVQVAISTATLPFVYGLARRAGSRRAGRIAAALFAVDPTITAFTHYLFSETLYVALLVGSAWVLFRRSEKRRRIDCLLGGVLFGLATLTRSVGLYFLPLWGLWALARRRRREARDVAIVLAVTLAVVLPWTLRNAFKYHGLLLVDGTLGRTAYFAFNDFFFSQDLGYLDWSRQPRARPECAVGDAPGLEPLPPLGELEGLFEPGMHGLIERRPPLLPISRARRFASIDLVAAQRCELSKALAFGRRHPGVIAEHMVRRFYGFWGPNSFLLRWVRQGVYGEGLLAPAAYGVLKWVVVAFHVGVLGSALLRIGRPLTPFARWAALFAAYSTFVHMLAVAHSRYRLPLMPFAMVLAAQWLAAPETPAGYSGWSGRAVLAALAAFVALCAHYALTRLP